MLIISKLVETLFVLYFWCCKKNNSFERKKMDDQKLKFMEIPFDSRKQLAIQSIVWTSFLSPISRCVDWKMKARKIVCTQRL